MLNYAKLSAIITILVTLITGTWWFSTNIVLASDFHKYQMTQQVRWLQYDKRAAWQEYISLRQLKNRTENESTRMLELEGSIKDINSNINAIRGTK